MGYEPGMNHDSWSQEKKIKTNCCHGQREKPYCGWWFQLMSITLVIKHGDRWEIPQRNGGFLRWKTIELNGRCSNCHDWVPHGIFVNVFGSNDQVKNERLTQKKWELQPSKWEFDRQRLGHIGDIEQKDREIHGLDIMKREAKMGSWYRIEATETGVFNQRISNNNGWQRLENMIRMGTRDFCLWGLLSRDPITFNIPKMWFCRRGCNKNLGLLGGINHLQGST